MFFDLVNNHNMAARLASKEAKLPPSTATSYQKRFADYKGCLHELLMKQERRKGKILDWEKELKSYVDETYGNVTLKEMRIHLRSKQGISIPLSTLRYHLRHRLQYTRKRA